jgi:hypothetical protein
MSSVSPSKCVVAEGNARGGDPRPARRIRTAAWIWCISECGDSHRLGDCSGSRSQSRRCSRSRGPGLARSGCDRPGKVVARARDRWVGLLVSAGGVCLDIGCSARAPGQVLHGSG